MAETKNNPALQSQTISGLVILFYKNLLSYSPKRYTNAYALCVSLATRYNEKRAVNKLRSLYDNCMVGYPLGLVETIAFRDLSLGRRVSSHYNYGHKHKMITLGDMIRGLDSTLTQIIDIFTDICVRHDIDPQITMPIIQGMELSKDGL